jgi:pimeloyl-ACP methyl ester carboxylesterase
VCAIVYTAGAKKANRVEAALFPEEGFTRWLRGKTTTMITRSLARVLALLSTAGAIVLGCAPRLLSLQDEAPAQILTHPGAPPVVDLRPEFRRILCGLSSDRTPEKGPPPECETLLWRLADEAAPPPGRPAMISHRPSLRVLIVPGAFGECFPEYGMPFEEAAEAMRRRHGIRIDFIPVGGRSGCDHNAAQIAAFLDKLPVEADEGIVLIGHSKGAVDILHFLVNHPEPARRVRAVVGVAGAINGSPLADFMVRGPGGIMTRLPLRRCPPGDRLVLDSLTRAYRMRWLAAHRLPPHAAYFSLGAFARREDIHPLMRFGHELLAAVEPRNDGYVAFSDQVIPGSNLLGWADLDHWDIALPIRERLNIGGAGSRAAARELLFEAVLLIVAGSLK